MANTIQQNSIQTLGAEEGFLHFVAREGRTFLRWTIGVCLVAIVICMVSPLWMAAVIPALFLLVASVLLVLTNEVERRSDPRAHDALERAETALVDDIDMDDAEADQLPPASAAIVKRESKTGILIVCGVMIVAMAIALIIVPSPVLAIGAFVVFAYMLLVAAPLWLGWIEDDIEIESHRQIDQPEPAAVKTVEG